MATLTISIPDAHRDRLAAFAAERSLSLNELIEDLSMRALAEHNTERRFGRRAARSDAGRGLEPLDKLDRHYRETTA